MAYLWEWYNDVKTAEPLTATEIKAWSELSGVAITPFEFNVLRMLDLTFWRIYNDRSRKASS